MTAELAEHATFAFVVGPQDALQVAAPAPPVLRFVGRALEPKVEAWRRIPVLVVTAKDLTEAERRRLSGDVTGLIQRGGLAREALLEQLREQVAAVGGPAR